MDRRKFVGAAAVTGAGAAVLDDTRLFGSPRSLGVDEEGAIVASHLLKLHMEIEGTRKEGFAPALALAQIADSVITDEATASAFAHDPKGYLARAGFPNVDLDEKSPQLKMARALAHPAVRRAARHGDVVEFTKALQATGVVPPITFACSPAQATCFTLVGAEAAAAAVVVIVAIAAVGVLVVAVALGAPANGVEPAVRLAAIAGGKQFANDVIKQMAHDEVERFIAGMETGEIEVAPGTDKRAVAEAIREKLALHLP